MNTNVILGCAKVYSGLLYFTFPGLTRTTVLLPIHCYFVINVILLHVYDHVTASTYWRAQQSVFTRSAAEEEVTRNTHRNGR